MTLQLVFDDILPVPPALRAVVGVERFGAVVYQRRSQMEAMRATAAAGEAGLIHLRTEGDRAALLERLDAATGDQRYLLCPSHLAPSPDADLPTFLRQLQHAPMSLHMPAGTEADRERAGWLLLDAPAMQKFLLRQKDQDIDSFFDEIGGSLAVVRDRVTLLDLRDERTMLHFLSGQFDARHFNKIEHSQYTLTKRSTDRIKLKREFDLYGLLPPSLQMFFVQPFDFQDDGVTASYSMERLAMPDMALQWVHRAFQPDEFERFLKHIFHFVSIRPQRRVAAAELAAVRQSLYVDKVAARIADLKRTAAYASLAPLLDRGCGGVDALSDRYFALYETMRRRFSGDALTIGHGDLCFSNILYSKTNQYLKLIDPRGGSTPDDIYTCPYYDVAKLSHSILGGYDLVNQDLFDVSVTEALKLELALESPSPAWAAPMFAAHVARSEFDLDLVRLCEASLFISMLPLHIDRPRKVLGFALTAASILDRLDETYGR